MKTKKFYDKVAESWYNVRHWTIFEDELKELDERWSSGRLLNVGCAHGADFLPFDKESFEFYGTDISHELLGNGKKHAEKFDRNFNLFKSDMSELPLKDETFDYLICVASLHHLLERKRRTEALKEIKRVLKKGGEAFITVWNKWQPEFLFRDKVIERRWDFKGETLKRKYYLYTYFELERDLKEAGFRVEKTYPENRYRFPLKYFSENILALVKVN